jgi:Phage P22-like portal protein
MRPDDEKPKTDEKRLRLAHERFRKAADAEDATRKAALEDLKFSVGEGQWPAAIAQRREEEGKPVMTMSQVDQHIKLVTNEQRQQRPMATVHPVGDGADKDTADGIQGAIRHIYTQSDAEIAHDTAFDYMVRGGFGYWRLLTERIPGSDDQEIKIKRIKNPFTVYVDPAAVEPDYSDARYLFITDTLTPEEYKDLYPHSELASLEDFSAIGDAQKEWATEHEIRIAEYFYVEGRGDDRRVKWEKINALETLDKTDWPGKWIPVIPVLGTDLVLDGKRYLAGLVRNGKEAQRAYNYAVSTAWEAAGLAPKAPFVATLKQIENYLPQWEQANRKNLAVLVYDHQADVPPPARQSANADLSAWAQLIQQAGYDLKAAVGLFNPSLGLNERDQSGKAIQSLQKQGDLSTLNYSDNLSRSIRAECRMLVDLIPHIYDAPRIQRIMHPDQSVELIGMFNSKKSGMSMDQVKRLKEMQGIKKIYDVGVGRYDITVSVGPSYQTKRQESVATQIELMKNVPIVQQAAPDMIIRNMDIPGADGIADRVKKLLPPQLQDDDATDPESRAQMAEAKLTQLAQQHQALTQALLEANQTIQAKKVESESKERIAAVEQQTQIRLKQMENEVKIAVAEITTKAQETQIRLQMEKEVWAELHGSAHDVALQTHGQAHDMTMADRAQAQTASEQAAAQANQEQQPVAATS